jgi:hypothetical protein
MRWVSFCGPSYSARSVNVDAERCINFYPEVVEGGTGKVKNWLVGTPGITGYVRVVPKLARSAPVRALFYQNGRAFAVVGQSFLEFFPSGRAIQWGDAVYDTNPAGIYSNGTAGHQLFIVSGGYFTIFNTQTNTYTSRENFDWTAATPPDDPTEAYQSLPYPVAMGAYLDGYFVALVKDSRRFQISALEDGLSWDGLDSAEVSTSGDNLLACATSHRELWLFGSQTTHVWYNSGAANFPLQPISGVQIEHGILAPWSVVNLDNTLFWLGADVLGRGVVWRANGYTPQRVSTHAVEYWLQKCQQLDKAIAYAYQEEGHAFYVLYVPDAETTWVYDCSTGAWHERATWDPNANTWLPHEGRCHCFAFGKHLIGSRLTGQIYHQSLDYYDEDVTLLDSQITAPSASSSQSASASLSPSLSASRSASASYSGSRSSSRSNSPSYSGSLSESSSNSASKSGSLSESASESASASASGGG